MQVAIDISLYPLVEEFISHAVFVIKIINNPVN